VGQLTFRSKVAWNVFGVFFKMPKTHVVIYHDVFVVDVTFSSILSAFGVFRVEGCDWQIYKRLFWTMAFF
jgi:hypothetical protein